MSDLKKLGGPYYPVIEQFAAQDGFSQPLITALPNGIVESMLPKYRKEIRELLPAFCIGGFIPRIKILGNDLGGNFPIGIIVYENNLDKIFDPDEMRFILAHEYSHIKGNHTLLQVAGGAAKSMLHDWINTQVKEDWLKSLYAMGLEYISVASRCHFTRRSEIEADSHASKLVAGGKATGIKVVEKLCNTYAGGDYSNPSHVVAGISVLTFQDRLDALKK